MSDEFELKLKDPKLDTLILTSKRVIHSFVSSSRNTDAHNEFDESQAILLAEALKSSTSLTYLHINSMALVASFFLTRFSSKAWY
jgi:hypothetical protein